MSGIGTFIIVCYTAIGLGLVGLLFYFLRRWRWRWLVAAPLLLGVIALAVAPYVEEAHIAAQFEELCKDAGIHVKRKVEAEGYLEDICCTGHAAGPVTSVQAVAELERRGFRFVEYRRSNSEREPPIAHIEQNVHGWEITLLERPRARYHLRESRPHQWIGHRLKVHERAIIDFETDEVIARDTTYQRIANSVDQAWMGLLGSTLRSCHGSRVGPAVSLEDQTINPIKR